MTSEQWVSAVKAIGPSHQLDTRTAIDRFKQDGEYKSDRHIKHLQNRIDDPTESEHQTVLWNTLPSANPNLLHAVYVEKLRQLQELGFGVVVLIFDRWQQEVQGSERNLSQNAAADFGSELLDWGLDPKQTEILRESDLRFAIDTNELIDTIVKLCEWADFSTDTEEEGATTSGPPAQIVRNAIEIHYEVEVNCDAILAGKNDFNSVWEVLRNTVRNHEFTDEYTEPLILGFPQLKGTNESDLASDDPSNSIYKGMDETQIERRLETSRTLREVVFEYLVLQQERGPMRVDGTPVGTYTQLTDVLSEQGCVDLLTEEARTHF